MRSPRHRVAAVALGLAVTATACTGSGSGPSHPHASHPEPVTVPSSTGSGHATPGPGMNPAAYRRILGRSDRPVSAALAAIAGADSPAVLSTRLGTAERTVGAAVTTLNGLAPPRPISAQHTALVQALRGLDTDLTELQSAVSGNELCAASAVLAGLGKLRSPGLVQTATAALQRKGYDTRLRMPPLPSPRNRRLHNGAYTHTGPRDGHGRLRITNSGSLDAVVSLVTKGQPAFAVYVRSGARVVVHGIEDGTYTAYFTTGKDWDGAGGGFTRSCRFIRYDDTFPFITTTDTKPGWSITLQQTINGDATTSEVDPENYPSG